MINKHFAPLTPENISKILRVYVTKFPMYTEIRTCKDTLQAILIFPKNCKSEIYNFYKLNLCELLFGRLIEETDVKKASKISVNGYRVINKVYTKNTPTNDYRVVKKIDANGNIVTRQKRIVKKDKYPIIAICTTPEYFKHPLNQVEKK